MSINSEAEEKNVSIWHVSPAETVSGLCDVMFAENYFVCISLFDFNCCG